MYPDTIKDLMVMPKISNVQFIKEIWQLGGFSSGDSLWLIITPSDNQYDKDFFKATKRFALNNLFREHFHRCYKHCEIDHIFEILPSISVKVPTGLIIETVERMQADDFIINIEFSRPSYPLRQASLYELEIEEGRRYLNKNKCLICATNIVIGMIDSGIDENHSEFSGKSIIVETVLSNPDQGKDTDGHGTGVASIMVGDPGIIPEATLYSVKALDNNYSVSSFKGAINLEKAIEKCLIYGVNIINISAGHSPCFKVPCDLCKAAARALNTYRCIIVAAAGDTHKVPKIMCPAQSESAIAVNAFDVSSWQVWPQCPIGPAVNKSTKPDLIAPGVNIQTAAPNNQLTTNTGTSFAAPFVSGALGLLLCKYDPLRVISGIKALRYNADVYPHWPHPRAQGDGIPKLYQALKQY